MSVACLQEWQNHLKTRIQIELEYAERLTSLSRTLSQCYQDPALHGSCARLVENEQRCGRSHADMAQYLDQFVSTQLGAAKQSSQRSIVEQIRFAMQLYETSLFAFFKQTADGRASSRVGDRTVRQEDSIPQLQPSSAHLGQGRDVSGALSPTYHGEFAGSRDTVTRSPSDVAYNDVEETNKRLGEILNRLKRDPIFEEPISSRTEQTRPVPAKPSIARGSTQGAYAPRDTQSALQSAKPLSTSAQHNAPTVASTRSTVRAPPVTRAHPLSSSFPSQNYATHYESAPAYASGIPATNRNHNVNGAGRGEPIPRKYVHDDDDNDFFDPTPLYHQQQKLRDRDDRGLIAVHSDPQPSIPHRTRPASAAEKEPVLGYARALYSYQATIPSEINMTAGQVLSILTKQEDGWWRGQVVQPVTGRIGLYPSNYVVELERQ
ncbi:src y domain-containing protein [Schizosaccharomyces japonicus yFS275]|uniref:Src y domain-containing protein n=1 Tax=Schizosaccharomyces japonicus (strain yFS275 / FY16936) TaxID=402676 RepID=B6K703_SCHJY|nr:src y domain-containing protein [Schizosaccharomyces japonicus yFS275]EEB09307.1 src y domain-containing protein [Schizosaccharomyces japonicus yFS275]